MAVDPDPTQVLNPEEPTQEMPTEEQPSPQLDENFQYEQFQTQERLSLVRQRLRDLESQHYNRRLDMLVAESGQADPILEEVSRLETKITELRQEEDDVQTEAGQQEQPQP
jgi:hypothetical protein